MRLLLAILLSLAAAPLALAQTQKAPIMKPDAFEVVALADGVHAVIRRDPFDDAANSNVLVIVNEHDVVVVDANLTDSSAEATIAAIRKLTPNPVRYVINTHGHDDHVLGNGTYAAAFPGVEFIAHPVTRAVMIDTVEPALVTNKVAYAEELKSLEARLEKGLRRDGTPMSAADREQVTRVAAMYRGFLAEIPRIRFKAPSVLLENGTMTLWRGDREIRVMFLGRGNTAGDLVVHLPKEGIVATGDLLVHPIPFAFGSFISDWMATLSRIEALNPRVMMPGHGDVQRDTRYLTLVRDTLGAISTHMRDAVAKGLTLEQASATLDIRAYREQFTGGDTSREAGFDYVFVTPASERAYQEAKGEIK